ncbi:MAG TPA: nuclear transport factor 2 family protein [Azospirillaceae bacterium]|nr:nuclear transport factor 2 family protein [Azospirillaceae bacterium]
MKVTQPGQMNDAFARAFNSRNIDELLTLYEPDAVLRVDGTDRTLAGVDAIAGELKQLLQVPGTMTSKNNFCVELGDLALLRADWELAGPDGTIVVAGSSAEVVRRQADGTWLYVIDHAMGAALPRVG